MFSALTQAQDKVRGEEGNLKREEKSSGIRIETVIRIQDLFWLLPQMPITLHRTKDVTSHASPEFLMESSTDCLCTI